MMSLRLNEKTMIVEAFEQIPVEFSELLSLCCLYII